MIKRLPFLILLIFIFSFGCAGKTIEGDDSFSKKLAAGYNALSTPEGKAYFDKLGPIVQSIMEKCLPPSAPPYNGDFILVGTVSSSGKISSVEVRPIDNITQCFAEHIKELTLPVPPIYSKGEGGYPIVIDMRITP